ncbi:arginase family protein [Pseudarthrobacter sp. NIBRBAC000502772]|uniref:arginase family protein n=1 Tax=Pseudarthrobacter sp. NIBRBAC000502772 TaxID=2590775 RepID=UPI00352D5ACB
MGADVVEVAPAYDHADITTLAATTLVFDLLGLMVNRSEGATRTGAEALEAAAVYAPCPCWPADAVGQQRRRNGPSNTSPRPASLPLPDEGWTVGTTDRCQFPGEGLDSAHNPSRGELQNPSLILCSGRADRFVFWAKQNRNRP